MGTTLKSILYVESDTHMRSMAKLVLEVIGKFEVHECSSARDALLAASQFTPDLILLDVMLPEQDGVATLEMLRRLPQLAATPALFVSDATAPGDLARYFDAGAFGVIPKPVAALRLSDQLNTLWERYATAH
jgi:CheY-like chemotaxis protein